MTTAATIMLVEDSQTQALQLQLMLENHGYQVVVARNGLEALELLNQKKPSIIVTDVLMPGMDGYELSLRVKENAAFKDTPVILLTMLSERLDIIRGLQSQADRFLTKPCEEEFLISTIRDVLRPPEVQPIQETPDGLKINYGGKTYCLTPKPARILALLITTYEAVIRKNAELNRMRDESELLNKVLEEKVRERTAALIQKNEELKKTTQQLWQAAKLATMGELRASPTN